MNSNIDEKDWVTQMCSLLNDDDDKADIKNHLCIFQVPKAIRNTKPEEYTPQVLALGPYHHFQPKTYYMQKCKLSVALKARQQLKLEIPEMLNAIKERLFDIRASYHDRLSLENETLAWMMLIDGLFLLLLIQTEGNRHEAEQKDQFEVEDIRGRKHSLNTILKDVVLLENQIPNIVLEALLDVVRQTYEKYNYVMDIRASELRGKLLYFCTNTNLSPIELKGDSPHYDMRDPHHVLDFLHQLVWLGKISMSIRMDDIAMSTQRIRIEESDKKTWKNLQSLLSNVKYGPLSVILAIVDLTLKILDALGISIPRDIFSEKDVPIPSASKLTGVGLKFCRIKPEGGGIKEIAFKEQDESVTLSLPAVSYNIDSDLMEVVMRNLLAYEAEAMPESSRFGRYVEIMSGLMQTTADVDILKNAGTDFHIVPEDANSLKVMELFSELKEAVGAKGKSELDETIGKVNEYYGKCRKVKIRRLAKKYLSLSWKVLNGIALMLVLILLVFQTFCSIYGCSRIFKGQYIGHLVL